MKELAKALIAAQDEMPQLTPDGKADVQTKKGGKYSYGYPTLPNVHSTALPHLRKHGVLVMQNAWTESHENTDRVSVTVETELIHAESGDAWKPQPLTMLSASDTPQDIGVVITYARRYALVTMLNLSPADDDAASVNQSQGNTQNNSKPNRQQVTLSEVPSVDTEGFSQRTAGMISALQDSHESSDGMLTEKQYNYMSGLIDEVAGKDMHGPVMQFIFGNVDKNKRPGFNTKELIAWLTSDNEGTKTATKEAVGQIAARVREQKAAA